LFSFFLFHEIFDFYICCGGVVGGDGGIEVKDVSSRERDFVGW